MFYGSDITCPCASHRRSRSQLASCIRIIIIILRSCMRLHYTALRRLDHYIAHMRLHHHTALMRLHPMRFGACILISCFGTCITIPRCARTLSGYPWADGSSPPRLSGYRAQDSSHCAGKPSHFNTLCAGPQTRSIRMESSMFLMQFSLHSALRLNSAPA
ncbi:hypothetical protein R3P38DRAFT_3190698 [Favolaschia claudopus]|uniref:Uncharacterized protein n=1 Tax=Favolaschia claudopus TaxID=2862362 RepID=A0AAW0BLX2_9AGAR